MIKRSAAEGRNGGKDVGIVYNFATPGLPACIALPSEGWEDFGRLGKRQDTFGYKAILPAGGTTQSWIRGTAGMEGWRGSTLN